MDTALDLFVFAFVLFLVGTVVIYARQCRAGDDC